MLYLVNIQRPLLAQTIELRLLAVERKYGLWSAIASPESITVPVDKTSLGNNKLALVEISAAREVIRITDAVLVLPSILHNLSLRVFKLLKQDQEIREWRESLEYQSVELNNRACALDAGEETLKVEQEKLAALEAELSDLLQDKAEVERSRIALSTALEAVRLEQKRLDLL